MHEHNGQVHNHSRQAIDGKVVVVTGASGGVGRALVRELGRRGCRIGLLARGRDGLEAAKAEVQQLGGKALVLPTDVADADQVEAAAEAIERELGPIDVWVNNAMLSMYAPFWELSAKEFRHITEATYLGQVYGTMSALRRMKPRNRGTIVQVGSALAHRSIPLQSAYCGAKHAVAGFTESLRAELFHERSKVRVTLVDLPAMNTTQFDWTKNRMPHKCRPTGPIYQPEVAVDGIIFAAEHPWRKKVIVGLPTLEAIVGEKFIPGLLDHYLAHAAWEGSQLPEPADPNHKDNFWQPLPGDHGSHGRFDAEARNNSPQLWASKHRTSLFAAAGIALAAVVLGTRGNNHNRRSIGGFL
jgi:NAD(P)-dependent dehydrogenase (short-subunit alcohol dehydrogenase family)